MEKSNKKDAKKAVLSTQLLMFGSQTKYQQKPGFMMQMYHSSLSETSKHETEKYDLPIVDKLDIDDEQDNYEKEHDDPENEFLKRALSGKAGAKHGNGSSLMQAMMASIKQQGGPDAWKDAIGKDLTKNHLEAARDF